MRAPTVTGLILAGGRGSRLDGRDKGWVAYRGRPLIEHALARLRPQVDAVVISANRNLDAYRALGVPVIADDPEFGAFAGPLAGILAALRGAPSEWLAVVPCDAPMLAPDLVARLRAVQRPAVAFAAARVQPLFCLLPLACADALADYLAHGGRKAETWLEEIGAARVAFDDAEAFANINTPQDLAAAP
jgi:molybdopterin-guanine dinucleotide biosynthesis protein A